VGEDAALKGGATKKRKDAGETPAVQRGRVWRSATTPSQGAGERFLAAWPVVRAARTKEKDRPLRSKWQGCGVAV